MAANFMTYSELKEQQAPAGEYFFAFSNEQFTENREKAGLKDKEVLRGPAGIFGSEQGIKDFFRFYDELDQKIKEQCPPQEVYNYEFNNHECSYTGHDTEAWDIVKSIYGEERAKAEVKRRKGYSVN